jgi:hypothetical protein
MRIDVYGTFLLLFVAAWIIIAMVRRHRSFKRSASRVEANLAAVALDLAAEQDEFDAAAAQRNAEMARTVKDFASESLRILRLRVESLDDCSLADKREMLGRLDAMRQYFADDDPDVVVIQDLIATIRSLPEVNERTE